MSTFGSGTGGASAFGPTELFRRLPYRGYRDPQDGARAWVEEWIDAIGSEFEAASARFISAEARAAMLGPSTTPAVNATDYLATSTSAPALAGSRDSMLDILAFLALCTYPLDGNLSTERKQALVAIGSELMQRKGTALAIRRYLATLADAGAVYAATSIPFRLVGALPDGEPTAGFGSWVSVAPETSRPWILTSAADYLAERLAPSWGLAGIGYSQFRLGFSSLSEPMFTVGATLNYLAHEHFDSWTAGVPDGWTSAGTGTLTQNSTDLSINVEFTSYCADIDQTAAAAGVVGGLKQASVKIDNSRTYRVEFDYAYRQGAAPYVAKLGVEILDFGNTLYWTGSAWTSTPTLIPLDPTATSTTRTRFSTTLTPNGITNTTIGTRYVDITIKTTSDGTSASKLLYRVWRGGLYEQFDYDSEAAAGGERTLYLPWKDGHGKSNVGGAAGGVVLEAANASRTSFKEIDTSFGSVPFFPYVPALTQRAAFFGGTWTNVVKGSCDFGADWTLSNYTRTGNDATPPVIGAGATCVTLTESGATPTASQAVVGATTAADRYVAGLLVKKVTADASSGGTSKVELTLLEGATIRVQRRFTLGSADGWKLFPLPACDALAGGSALTLRIRTISGSAAKFAMFGSYCYLATTRSTVLYPPIVKTGIGATASFGAVDANPLTYGNVYDPWMRQPLLSLTRGGLNLTAVPILTAGAVPNCYLFDCGEAAAKNRISLMVASGVLVARLIDDAGTSYSAALTLSALESPPAGSVTWIRDRAVTIRMRWDASSGVRLSAGDAFASNISSLPWTVSDAALDPIYFSRDGQGVGGYFEGHLCNVELVKCGANI